jgi:hypothetical protein
MDSGFTTAVELFWRFSIRLSGAKIVIRLRIEGARIASHLVPDKEPFYANAGKCSSCRYSGPNAR